jgi:Flp pilus assembly pilin Flp
MLKKFIKSTDGATAIEYALICSVLFLGIAAAIQGLAGSNSGSFNSTVANVNKAL